MYKEKYIKYKTKYTALKKQLGGYVINYKNEEFNIIEQTPYDKSFQYEIIINKQPMLDDDNIKLKLIISYKQNAIRICLENRIGGSFHWIIILSDNSIINLNKDDKSTEFVNQIKLFISWINNKERQIKLYTTINNYLEIFYTLYMEQKFQIVRNISEHVELLHSVKTKITELITTTNDMNKEAFNIYNDLLLNQYYKNYH